jgi:hypothetical protein
VACTKPFLGFVPHDFFQCTGGHRDLFFWNLFFYRNYLFIEDLLTVSRFPCTLTLKRIKDEELVYEDLVKNKENDCGPKKEKK